MVRYQNLGGDSNVYAYKIDPSQITVSFYGGGTYVYSYSSAGVHKINTMKSLAARGYGLNSYINRHAKYQYVR